VLAAQRRHHGFGAAAGQCQVVVDVALVVGVADDEDAQRRIGLQ
jgi:hypothetical protein